MIKPFAALSGLALLAACSSPAPPPPPPPPPPPLAIQAPLPPPPPVAPSYTQSYGGPRVGPSLSYGKPKKKKVHCKYNQYHQRVCKRM